GSPDGARTLLGLAAGTSVGMCVGAAALLAALRRSAGAGSLDGVARTLVVLLVGAAVGALLGRWAVDAVMELADGGDGVVVLVGAAVAGALLTAVVVVGTSRAADAGVLQALRSAQHRD